jgi:hypothetical protein
MKLINYAKERRSAATDLKRYERLGIKIFTEALKLQAKPNPSPLPMQEAYIKFYQTVFVESATKEFNRIRQYNQAKAYVPDGFFLNTWREWIKDWVLQNLGTLITGVNQNTLEQIQKILGEGIEQGLNPFQLEKLLLEQIPNISRARAIARTESTRAYNEGKKRSANDWAKQTGTTLWKLWIHGGSREPRFQHIQAQNKPIPANGFFDFLTPKGEIVLMDKPGDINGGPSQTINCSCVVVYISEAYARRNFPEWFNATPRIPATPSQGIIPTIEAEPAFIPTQAKYTDYNQFKNEYLKLTKGGKYIDDDEVINNKFETVQNTIAEIQGFRGLPKVLSNEEFLRLSKDPEYTLLYRGISDSVVKNLKAEDLINQYSKGELYGARANMFGNGTYWATESQYSVANTYAFGNDNNVFPALIKKSDMKLGAFEKLVSQWEREKQAYSDSVVKSWEIKMNRTALFGGDFARSNPKEFYEMIDELKLFSEFGAWATSKGYDGYTVDVPTNPGNNFGFARTDYVVTLNRTKTIVSQSLRGKL